MEDRATGYIQERIMEESATRESGNGTDMTERNPRPSKGSPKRRELPENPENRSREDQNDLKKGALEPPREPREGQRRPKKVRK